MKRREILRRYLQECVEKNGIRQWTIDNTIIHAGQTVLSRIDEFLTTYSLQLL